MPQSHPLSVQAYAFVRQIAEGGPGFLATHLPERFVVGTTTGAGLVERDRFIQAALGRADMVATRGLAAPVLDGVDVTELGAAYALLTAHWTMCLPRGTWIWSRTCSSTGPGPTGSAWPICCARTCRDWSPPRVRRPGSHHLDPVGEQARYVGPGMVKLGLYQGRRRLTER